MMFHNISMPTMVCCDVSHTKNIRKSITSECCESALEVSYDRHPVCVCHSLWLTFPITGESLPPQTPQPWTRSHSAHYAIYRVVNSESDTHTHSHNPFKSHLQNFLSPSVWKLPSATASTTKPAIAVVFVLAISVSNHSSLNHTQTKITLTHSLTWNGAPRMGRSGRTLRPVNSENTFSFFDMESIYI